MFIQGLSETSVRNVARCSHGVSSTYYFEYFLIWERNLARPLKNFTSCYLCIPCFHAWKYPSKGPQNNVENKMQWSDMNSRQSHITFHHIISALHPCNPVFLLHVAFSSLSILFLSYVSCLGFFCIFFSIEGCGSCGMDALDSLAPSASSSQKALLSQYRCEVIIFLPLAYIFWVLSMMSWNIDPACIWALFSAFFCEISRQPGRAWSRCIFLHVLFDNYSDSAALQLVQHNTHRGARAHGHKVKGLALYRLS